MKGDPFKSAVAIPKKKKEKKMENIVAYQISMTRLPCVLEKGKISLQEMHFRIYTKAYL